MSKIRIYARNMAANWGGHSANLAMTMASSWFAFHMLGDIRYGIWSLVISLTGYLGMVDLGMRPALSRYFNWHLGRDESRGVNEVLCTSLAFFLVCSVVLLALGIVLGTTFRVLFPKTPAEYFVEVRLAIAVVALNLGLSMIVSAFNSLVDAHERYDLQNLLNVVVGVVRTALTILVLTLGFGLAGMAVVSLVSTVLACLGGYAVARRVFPGLRIASEHISASKLRELIRFGIPCFFSGIGIRIMQHTDSLIIAWLIGLPAVGYYSLARMLLEYSRSLVARGGVVFTPEIQQSIAREDFASLRTFVPMVTRLTMGLAVLVVVGIMAFGADFLGLFYGGNVAAAGAQVLVLLGMAHLAALANQGCGSSLVGAGRVKFLAVVVLVQAAANLVLSIFFVAVAGMGLQGVALGTMIPAVVLSGMVIPAVAARHLHISPSAFALETAGYWVPAAGLFALGCFGISHLSLPLTWSWFAVKVALVIAIYIPIYWFVILPRAGRQKVLSLAQRR